MIHKNVSLAATVTELRDELAKMKQRPQAIESLTNVSVDHNAMIADMVAQIVELRHEFEDLSLAQRDTPKKQQANDVADNMLKGNNVKAVAEPSSAKTQPPALVNIITCRYVDGTVSISSPAGMSTGRFPLPMPAESGDDAAVAEGERGARGSSDRLHQASIDALGTCRVLLSPKSSTLSGTVSLRKELQHIRLAHEQCGATVAAKDAQIEELQTLRKMQLYKLQGARECISSLTKQVEEARRAAEAAEREAKQRREAVERLQKARLEEEVQAAIAVKNVMELKVMALKVMALKAITLNVAQRLMISALVEGFERWRDQAAEDKQMKAKALKVVQRLMNRVLGEGFKRWRTHVAQLMSLVLRRLRSDARLFISRLAAAWCHWCGSVLSEKQLRCKARRIAKRVLNVALAQGFEIWVLSVSMQEETQIQHCVNVTMPMIARLQSRTVRRAFEAWYERALEGRQMEAMALKVVRRLMRRALVDGFERWRTHAAQLTSLVVKGCRDAARLMKSMLAAAWCPWSEFVACQKQLRCKARRIVERMVNVALAHGFESWVLSVSMQEENPIQQSVSITMPVDFGMIAASETAQQSFDEALKAQICACLDIPPGSVHVLCHQRGSVKAEVILSDVEPEDCSAARSALRLAKDLAKACVDTTSVFATCGLKLCASRAELHGPVSRHVMNAVTSSITEQRATTTLARDRNKHGAVQLMKRIMMKRSMLLFGMWAEGAAEARGFKAKALKVVQRLMSRVLGEDFERWRDHVADVRQEQVMMMKDVQLLVKVLQPLMNSALVGCFECWCEHAAEEKQARAKTLNLVQQLMNIALGGCFERWRDHVAERRQEMVKTIKDVQWLVKVVQRLMSRELMKCLQLWQDSVVEDRQMKAKALKVMQRLMSCALGEGFERWRDTWQRQNRFRTKAGKALHHIVHGAMSKTVNSWQKATASSKRLGIRISQRIARLQSRAMRCAFEAWYERAQE